MHYIGIMHVYLCFTKEEANIFKVGIVIEVLFFVQHWPLFGGLYFCEGPDWPPNLNSDWIHHKLPHFKFYQ